MTIASSPQSKIRPLAGKKFAPPRLGMAYRMGLVLVALAMPLLVAIYFLLVLAALAALAAHVYFNFSWIFAPTEPVMQVFMAMVYASVIVLGILMTLFLLKPLIAKKNREKDGRYVLPAKGEVEFYTYVHDLCDFLKAKRPSRIVVDLSPNASASIQSGIFGFISGKMELTIGLPLVAGMTTRQLAGIIAHELGHFTQGGAMRLSSMAWRLQGWFLGMVETDDSWDENLKRWTEEWGPWGLIPLVARGMIWCTRKVLYLLVFASALASRYMNRQMEFHADCFEALIAGSEDFEETMRQLALLSFATSLAKSGNMEAWREERLVDDLPNYIVDHVDDLPPEALQEAFADLEKQKTEWLETHPAFQERVTRVRALAAPGLYHHAAPAASLFAHFEELCRQVTKTYYKQALGRHFNERFVASKETVIAEQRASRESFRASSCYFQGVFNNVGIPFLLQAERLREPEEPAQVVEDIKSARAQLQAALPAITAARRRFVEGTEGIVNCEAVIALLKGEVKITPNSFGLAKPTRPNAEAKMRESYIARNTAREELSQHVKQAENRLLGALSLLHTPQMQERLKGEPITVQQAEETLRNYAHVCFVLDLVETLREKTSILAVLLQCIPAQGIDENHALAYRVRDYITEVNRSLSQILQPLKTNLYPFEHSAGKITIADYALKNLPHPYDLQGVFASSQQLTENVYTLYFRLLAKLVGMATRVEKIVGIPPLPEPPVIEAEEAVMGD